MYHVVVNHENDTCFGNGLVIGYADCKCLAGLVETSKVVSIVSLALCQTHCKQVPEFSRLSKSDLIMLASLYMYSTTRCNCSLYANHSDL